MALQTSGTISISNINTQLGRGTYATSSLNESALRTLAEVPSGTIALSNFYGKPPFSTGTWTQSVAGTYNFTVPSGIYIISYVVIGGGAGGGGGSEKDPYCSGGGGGGAGALMTGTLNVSPGQVLSCVVGAGGSAWPAFNQSGGSTPGSSTINTTTVVAANGGKPTTSGGTWWRPGRGTSGTNSVNGTSGGFVTASSSAQNGGAGGYVPGYSTGGVGGTGSGAAGVGPGAGGGGGATTGNNGGNYAGGPGNDGMVRIIW